MVTNLAKNIGLHTNEQIAGALPISETFAMESREAGRTDALDPAN